MNNRDNQKNFRKAFRKQIRKEQIKEFAQINKLKRQSAAWDSSFHLGDIVKFKSDSIEIEEISNIY